MFNSEVKKMTKEMMPTCLLTCITSLIKAVQDLKKKRIDTSTARECHELGSEKHGMKIRLDDRTRRRIQPSSMENAIKIKDTSIEGYVYLPSLK